CPPRGPRIPQTFENGRFIPKDRTLQEGFSLAAGGGSAPIAAIWGVTNNRLDPRTHKRHSPCIGARRRVSLTPPASRLCAGRRNKWLRTKHGSSAPRNIRRPLNEQCSNNDHRCLTSGPSRVRRRQVQFDLSSHRRQRDKCERTVIPD